jgi:hypothetical protein
VSKSIHDNMDRQTEFTKAFLQQTFVESLITPEFILHHKKLWWRNPYKPNSLNLTKAGFVQLRDILKIEMAEFDLTETLSPLTESLPFRDIQLYDNGLDGPWYVRKNQLVLFGSKDITLTSLYGVGNLRKMLKRKVDK